MDDVRRNCLFSSVDVDDLLLLLFDRPIRLRNPLLINFFVEFVVEGADGELVIGLSEDVFTSKLFNGIDRSTAVDDDDGGSGCFNKSIQSKNAREIR